MKPCPLYESLLADKDLDEEMRALIMKLIEEEAVDIAREKAASKCLRSKSLADLSVLVADPSLLAGEVSHCMPGNDVHAPRDRKKIGETEDILFLAMLLERSRESSEILQCAPASGTGGWILVVGEDPSEGFIVKQRLSHKGIRRIFRDKVYGFRRALGSPEAACMNFSINGIEVRRAGGRGDKTFWHFASRLYHPFHRAGDNLLDSLHSRRLLDFPKQARTITFSARWTGRSTPSPARSPALTGRGKRWSADPGASPSALCASGSWQQPDTP